MIQWCCHCNVKHIMSHQIDCLCHLRTRLCNMCVSQISPEGSLWCNGPCWSTGGTGSSAGVFCWASLALKKGKGQRNGPSGSWVRRRCCSGSHRATHSYTRCCLRPAEWEWHHKRFHFNTELFQLLSWNVSRITYCAQDAGERAGQHYHMNANCFKYCISGPTW